MFEEDTFASDLLSEATATNLAIKVVSAAGRAVPDNVVEWAGPANAAFVDLDGAGLTSLGGTIHMTHTRIRP